MGKGRQRWNAGPGDAGTRPRRWPRASPAVLALAIALVSTAGPAAAHGAGSAHPDDWIRLVTIVLVMAAIIAGVVYGAIILAIWRYREGSPYVRKPPRVHDPKMESVWTMVPVIMVTLIVALSLQVMYETDEIPDEGVHIQVIGKQYAWIFVYPDNTTALNELWIEEGQTVIFEIIATDVVHSFFLPDFFLKVDAFPGYYDEAWLVAEPAGDYDIWCAEYCGEEHTEMTGVLHIYPKGISGKPFGPPPGEVPPPPEVRSVNATLEISETGGGTEPTWAVSPPTIELPLDAEVSLRVWNNASSNFSLSLSPPYRRSIADIPPGESRFINFTADKPTAGTTCVCRAVDGEYEAEVTTTLRVVPDIPDLPSYQRDDDVEAPWVPILFGVALGILAVSLYMAVRPPKRPDADEEVEPEEEGHEEEGPGEEEPPLDATQGVDEEGGA